MSESDKSLGDEKTFGDANPEQSGLESLGDEMTLGGLSGSEEMLIDQDMEVVDLSARYTIEGVLGKGGMGEVLLATDTRLKRKVAVKRILGEAARSKTALSRFLTEAQSIAALNHANIVQIYDYGRDEAGPFLIMEYVDGKSLLDLCQEGPLPVEKAIELTCQLCDGLGRAHDAGIIHRDIKPANILLTEDGIPKLTDFGLAKAETADTGMTMAGAVLGTLDFMPPEQRKDAALTDARSDLWSLAATLYQMISGKSPKIIKFNDLPESTQPVLERALEDEKAARHQSARELKDDLIAIINKPLLELEDDRELKKGECHQCGTINELQRKFCDRCGENLLSPCVSCDVKIAVWEKFCPECGANGQEVISQRKEQCEEEKKLIEELQGRFDYTSAIQHATTLSQSEDAHLAEYRKWATERVSQLTSDYKGHQDNRNYLLMEANNAIKSRNYGEVSKLIAQIPEPLQDGEVLRVLSQAEHFRQEIKDLLDEIRGRVKGKQLDGLWDITGRFLELRPNHTQVQDLHEKLLQRKTKREQECVLIYQNASRHFRSFDDEQAISVLQNWPAGVEFTEAAQGLLNQCQRREEQAKQLLQEIKADHSVQRYSGLLEKVQRYLQLRPNDQQIRPLITKLADIESNRKVEKSQSRKTIATYVIGFAALAVVVLIATAFIPPGDKEQSEQTANNPENGKKSPPARTSQTETKTKSQVSSVQGGSQSPPNRQIGPLPSESESGMSPESSQGMPDRVPSDEEVKQVNDSESQPPEQPGEVTEPIPLAATKKAPTWLNQNLIAYYPFNGDAKDESGNGNDGVVNKAKLVSGKSGEPKTAYSFANADAIRVPNKKYLNFTNPSAFAISFWAQRQGPCKFTFPINKADGPGGANKWTVVLGQYEHAQGQPKTPYLGFHWQVRGKPQWTSSKPILLDDSWHHYLITKQSGNFRFYIDGTSHGSSENSTPLVDTKGEMVIGKSHEGEPPFNGAISDVRIYNRSLSAEEVKQLYEFEAAPSVKQNPPVKNPPLAATKKAPTWLNQNLIAYYPFNGNAKDESEKGNDALLKGGASIGVDRFGNKNSALELDGIDDCAIAPYKYYVDIPKNDFTISFWTQIKNREGPIHFLGQSPGNVSGTSKWIMHFSSNFSFHLNSQNRQFGAHFLSPLKINIPESNWISYTLTKRQDTYAVFVDGQKKSTGPGPDSYPKINADLTIGQAENGGWLKGKMDDIRIYNRSLSAEEVKQLYEFEAAPPVKQNPPVKNPPLAATKKAPTWLNQNLVAYYPFNGNAKDESGNGNDGSVNGARSMIDRHGNTSKAFYFNGKNNFISVPHNPKLNFSEQLCTVSFWAKVANAEPPIHFIGKGDLQSKTKWIFINTGHADGIDLSFHTYSPSGGANFTGRYVLKLPQPDWHQYLAVAEGNQAAVYIDGQLMAKNAGRFISQLNNNAGLTIGQVEGGGWLQGMMDDIRIYNRALSAAEVKSLYEYEK